MNTIMNTTRLHKWIIAATVISIVLGVQTTSSGLEMTGDVDFRGEMIIAGPNGVDGDPGTDAPDVLTVIGGDGGDDTSGTNNGGDGGGIGLTAGSGGSAGIDSGSGGAAGGITLTAGDGGDTPSGTGAVGGAIALTTGVAGLTDSGNGVKGGAFTVTTGVGGVTTDEYGGDGGNIELTTGAGGTGPYGNGSYGDVIMVKNGGNIGIKTTTFNSLANGVLAIGNGTEPSSGTANQAYLYAKDDAGKSHIYTMDEDGNATKLGPHNDKGEWEFYSVNVRTGRVVRVNMEKLVMAVEKLTGEKLMMESYEE